MLVQGDGDLVPVALEQQQGNSEQELEGKKEDSMNGNVITIALVHTDGDMAGTTEVISILDVIYWRYNANGGSLLVVFRSGREVSTKITPEAWEAIQRILRKDGPVL